MCRSKEESAGFSELYRGRSDHQGLLWPAFFSRAGMLGGAGVPYGKLWRTGANEPTIFYTPTALRVAGIEVKPGVYSLYTVPAAQQWEVIVNRSISQWGKENQYTDAIKAQEVGRAKVKSESLSKPIETFTIRAEPGGKDAVLLLEWEKTRVRIPVQARR